MALPLLLFVLLVRLALAAETYQLDTAYESPASFLFGWDFFSGPDPTHGFVRYVDRAAAAALRLVSLDTDPGPFSIAVDVAAVLDSSGPGRASVRITTRKAWTHGLFAADIAHMPGPACGIWPAFWMFGPNWPNSGEIDMVEGVSLNSRNIMTLHTSSGCTMPPQPLELQASTMDNGECNSGVGCSVTASSAATYGAGFNAGGGGTYATEWTSAHIKTWFFPRGTIPADLAAASPAPETWGVPLALFEGTRGCQIDSHFMNMNLAFNTAFCGDWAGNRQLWEADPVCGKLAPSCEAYVAANPAAFKDGSWIINSVKVYTLGAVAPSSPPTAPSPPPPSSPSALKPSANPSSPPQTSSFSTISTPIAPPAQPPVSGYETQSSNSLLSPTPLGPSTLSQGNTWKPPLSTTSQTITIYSTHTIFFTITVTGSSPPTPLTKLTLAAGEYAGHAGPLSSLAHALFHRSTVRASASNSRSGCRETGAKVIAGTRQRGAPRMEMDAQPRSKG